MAEAKPLTSLDANELMRFIETELADFVIDTDRIRKDDDMFGRALKSLLDKQATPKTLQQNQFLAIGAMVQDDLTHGKSLIEAVTNVAKSMDDILEDQERLFKDIDKDFREVVKVLSKTQGANITSIDAEKALEILSDVDNDLRGGGETPRDSDSTKDIE
ncbi:type VII secretion system-associated protein [Streptomyces tendae]